MTDVKPQQNEIEMEFNDVQSTSSSFKKIKLKSTESIDDLIKKAHDALNKK